MSTDRITPNALIRHWKVNLSDLKRDAETLRGNAETFGIIYDLGVVSAFETRFAFVLLSGSPRVPIFGLSARRNLEEWEPVELGEVRDRVRGSLFVACIPAVESLRPYAEIGTVTTTIDLDLKEWEPS